MQLRLDPEISKVKFLIESLDIEGAVEENSLEKVRHVLLNGGDPNWRIKKDEYNRTILHTAARCITS